MIDVWRRQNFWVGCLMWGAVMGGGQGCTQVACDGRTYEPQAGAPVINDIQLSQPLAKDPWQVVMDIDFSDSGGDLGTGYAFLYINGLSPPKAFPLAGYFETSALDPASTDGHFALYFPLTVDQIPDGSIWLLETQLEDGSKPDPDGLRSNCYQLRLDFSITPAATTSMLQAMPQKVARLWRRLGGWLGEGRPS